MGRNFKAVSEMKDKLYLKDELHLKLKRKVCCHQVARAVEATESLKLTLSEDAHETVGGGRSE